jgi:hypothetical protein
MWTKDRIVKLLNTNDRAVEKAIVAIYDRQTQDEKSTSSTNHTNHRGFRQNHASKGSYYARWVNSGRRLTGHHLANARKIALQYHRQLCEVANAKASETEEQAMQQMEAEGDRAQTRREEQAKADWKARNEGPIPGTYAFTARLLAQSGLMTGEEADAWKDQMKDASMDDAPPSGEPV